ncbi:MAG: autotransporter-associated beta strand repeat-containing protein, partial [Verrucomicrobiota bacterium]
AGIAAGGSLMAPGTTITINIIGSGWVVSATPIPLITYTGATLGSIANFTLNMPPGVTGHLVNNANVLGLQIDTAVNLSWNGDVNNVWDIGTTANWKDNGTSGKKYSNGDPVRFDDTATGNLNISLPGSVSPSSFKVDATGNYSITGAGSIGGGTSIVKTNTGSLVLNTVNTYTGGTVIGNGTLTISNATALGATSGTVSLKGGILQFGASTSSAHPVAATANSSIDVVSGVTATLSGAVSGNSVLSKTGAGALVMSGNATYTGTLRVVDGTVNLSSGTRTFNGSSYAGYLNGQGNLNLTGGSNYFAGDFRVGGSPTSGVGIAPTGTVTIANSTMSVGSLTVARGNNIQNSCVGTVTVNSGGTLNSEGDIVLDFAGDVNNQAVFDINSGGTVNIATTVKRWFIVSQWDLGDAALNINGGQLNLNAVTDLRYATGNNNGTNVVNLNSGAITFYSDNKTTVGGAGVVDMHQGSGASTNVFNLNGGVLSTFGVVTANNSGSRRFNFNGGTLRAIGNNATFMNLGTGNGAVNVRNGGAIIDTGSFIVTNAYVLRHSDVAGDNAIDGGLTKLGAGTLTLTASNNYTGNTTINNGTLAINSPYLPDAANVSIAAAGQLRLNFAGTDVVNGLTIAGITKANGTYGATGSGAANIDDAHFAGTGVLQVGPPKPTLNVVKSGNTLTFNWSGAYKLVAQTNSLSVGLQSGAAWYDVPGGATSGVAITIDPTKPTVFFGLTPTP